MNGSRVVVVVLQVEQVTVLLRRPPKVWWIMQGAVFLLASVGFLIVILVLGSVCRVQTIENEARDTRVRLVGCILPVRHRLSNILVACALHHSPRAFLARRSR